MKSALVICHLFALAAVTFAFVVEGGSDEYVDDEYVDNEFAISDGDERGFFNDNVGNNGCSCQHDVCQCCTYIIHKSVCIELTFNFDARTMEITIKMGGSNLISKAVPLDGVENICAHYSLVFTTVKLCLDVNVRHSGSSLQACPKLDAVLGESQHLGEIKFGCIVLHRLSVVDSEAIPVENSVESGIGFPTFLQ